MEGNPLEFENIPLAPKIPTTFFERICGGRKSITDGFLRPSLRQTGIVDIPFKIWMYIYFHGGISTVMLEYPMFVG